MSEPKRDDEPTMEEILASIRKIISEDDPGTVQASAVDETADAPDEAASDGAGELEEEPPRDAKGDDAEPMELTQMVSEDGSVVDLRNDPPESPPAAEEPSPAEAPAESSEDSRPAIVKPLVPEGAQIFVDRDAEDEEVAEPAPQEPAPMAREADFAPEAEPAEMAEGAEAPAAPTAQEAEAESLISADATAAATAAMSRLKDRLVAGNVAVGGGSDKSLEALARETMAPHLKSWLDRNLPELVERIVREEIEKLVKASDLR